MMASARRARPAVALSSGASRATLRARPAAAAAEAASPAAGAFSLRGRVVVVTGASSGIGGHLAAAFAQHGADVVAIARRAERLEALVEGVNEAHEQTGGESGRAAAVAADLLAEHRAEGGMARVAEQCAAPFGAVDVVVNCAGVNLRQPWDEITPESWAEQLDLHLAVPFFLAREFVPGMTAKGRGKVINIASLTSTRAMPNSLPYSTAKGGTLMLTKSMAETWGERGITANAIAPGYFETELTAAVFADNKRASTLANSTALGRNGKLDDLVGAAVFLASGASDYITGQTLYVDGGFTAMGLPRGATDNNNPTKSKL